jgi:Uma2 family endonuclease
MHSASLRKMPPRGRATYDDIVALPEHVTGELIDGELHTQPRPAVPHARVASGLGMDLGGPFDRGRGGPGDWIILDEAELHLGDDVLVPDLSGFRRDRLTPAELDAPYFTTPPDWVCEVVSKSTATRDRMVKAPRYALHRVAFLWLVDPIEARIDAFERAGERWLWLGTWAETADARIPPFDAVGLDLLRLFGDVAPAR